MAEKIRVLIVDDQQLVREGIASLLALDTSIEVVGTAIHGRDCLSREGELRPDVILMDIRMPVMDGITAVEQLRQRGSDVHILMLTTFDDEEYVVKSLRAGAEGYLMKDVPMDSLVRSIVQVYNGTFQVAPGVMNTLLRQLGNRDERDERDDRNEPEGAESSINSSDRGDPEIQRIWEGMSVREQEILRLLGKGATNREIAQRVHLSEGTVKNYVSDILTSLDLRDRTQAALAAVKNGWDRDPD